MNRLTKVIIASLSILIISGCFSPGVYQESKQKVALRRAILSNNQAAIQAIRLGKDSVGLGIDLTKLEVLKEQPLKQTVAAVADALLIWGGYEGVRWAGERLNNSGSGSNGSGGNRSDNGGTTVTVDGSGNEVNVGNTQESTQESTQDSTTTP